MIALSLAVFSITYVRVHGNATRSADRDADKQAIDTLIKQQIQAFNSRDAAAIAANWTTDAEYLRNDGDPIRGRDAIQKGYAEFFKTLTGKSNVEVQTDNMRFPSNDTAYTEVTLRLKNEAGEMIGSSWRNTLLVREAGTWKVAMVQEWDRDTSNDDTLNDLAWLIGTWSMDTPDRKVTTTYEWDENKTFIRGKFSTKQGDKPAESGTQFFGKDNANGGIRSWVFQSDGGYGDGSWKRDGKKWMVDFTGVSAEGKNLSATVVYMRVDADTFTWQAVEQTVDGQPIADTQPIKVSKQKAGQ
jgi:uncharacterized protein (TIGR02246 family)